MPFLLRGVSLLGIDSVMCPAERRRVAWSRLARELPLDKLDALTEVVSLGALPELAQKILKGGIRGRVVVDVRN
jgi:acrylyl-CoA reductase (NADPH)